MQISSGCRAAFLFCFLTTICTRPPNQRRKKPRNQMEISNKGKPKVVYATHFLYLLLEIYFFIPRENINFPQLLYKEQIDLFEKNINDIMISRFYLTRYISYIWSKFNLLVRVWSSLITRKNIILKVKRKYFILLGYEIFQGKLHKGKEGMFGVPFLL